MDVMELIGEQKEFDRAVDCLCESWACRDAGDSDDEAAKGYRAYTDSLAKTYGVPFAHVAEVVRDAAAERYAEAV